MAVSFHRRNSISKGFSSAETMLASFGLEIAAAKVANAAQIRLFSFPFRQSAQSVFLLDLH
jgi:hypothetical protein